MKSAVALLCLAAMAFAAPQLDERPVAILRDERVDQGDGNFNYAFAADNGIEMEVSGAPGAEGAVSMRGYYLLPLIDGGFARVEFVADEGGFQPISDILPTPHPMPAHALEQIRIAEQQRAEGIQFDIQGRRVN
ncbi:cuticle protein AM1274-like [Palaemon carinicauda]|uniref:cuticle protein AM1274-like n=1 Tax=Palaemon carinicauda TaxID=392227 RepID=UPI0035B5AACB